jgi:hypothetical protein
VASRTVTGGGSPVNAAHQEPESSPTGSGLVPLAAALHTLVPLKSTVRWS